MPSAGGGHILSGSIPSGVNKVQMHTIRKHVGIDGDEFGVVGIGLSRFFDVVEMLLYPIANGLCKRSVAQQQHGRSHHFLPFYSCRESATARYHLGATVHAGHQRALQCTYRSVNVFGFIAVAEGHRTYNPHRNFSASDVRFDVVLDGGNVKP